MRNIYIIGIGMGNPNSITVNGIEKINISSTLIGAKRMVESFSGGTKKALYAIASDDILKLIKENEEEEHIAVLMSGDVGFFSGTEKLRQLIKKEYGDYLGNSDINFEYIPGVSSISYLSSRIGISWEDAKIVSLHGRKEDDTSIVLNHEKVFFLTDGTDNTVSKICSRLTNADLGDVKVYVGEKLSYKDEKITCGLASELLNQEFESLSVMMIINNKPLKREKDTLGIRDEEFIRGSVPMTKEEVRTLAVSKLDLKENDIVYDIGAGTGSISIELALACRYGSVYAIETNIDGIDLIEKNKLKFNTKNLKIINGMAPDALKELPSPNKAFIGGSKGNLEQIIGLLLCKNKDIKIVIDVVALESLAETINCIKSYGFKYVDIAQVNISKAKTLGKYNLMMGQNPVYIISVQGIEEN
ncbi:MAG: precorrin-6y C5,15-methyltransferase (decarboxylating) subunit CbiE [Aminipila sp.]